MNIKALVTAACLTVASVMPGYAVTVDVVGDTYDVTTITGSFLDNQTLLEDQVWWGDSALALDFAGAVGSLLGFPNLDIGPFFAFGENLVTTNVLAALCEDTGTCGIFGDINAEYSGYTYAIASLVPAIPLPASAFLMLAGLGGLAALRRKQKPNA